MTTQVYINGPEQVAGAVPVGGLVPYGGTTLPAGGWLFGDGTVYTIAAFPVLGALYGNRYGGDGVTTFGVPDLRGRTVIGVGQGSGLTNRTLAQMIGEETHLLITAELPNLTHVVSDPGHDHGSAAHTHSLVTSGNNGVVAIQNSGPNQGISGGGPGGGSWAVQATASTTPGNVTVSHTGITVSDTNGNGAHNNMQPSIVLNWLVKT